MDELKNDKFSNEDKFLNEEYLKGYQNGINNADKIDFQGYLENKVRYENMIFEINDKIETKADLISRISIAKQECSHYHERMQAHHHNIEIKNARLGRLGERLGFLKNKIEKYNIETDNHFEEYSVLAGIIFFAAGIIFMTGDLIISHEIVAYALNIRNNTEAWLFAGGLACLSILFKPVYDRLFEKIYKKQSSEGPTKNYIKLKGVLVIFAIITLFVLGWFRFEAYRINEQKSNLNRLISSLQEENMGPERIKQIEALLAQQQGLSAQLVNSFWGLFSFVLTGILFAVSGAICLGIGLPILQFYWRIWMQIPLKMLSLNVKKKKVTKKIEKEEAILAGEKTHYSITNFEFESRNDLSSLENDLKNVIAEINELQKQKSEAESDYMVSMYLDGYANGAAALNSKDIASPQKIFQNNLNEKKEVVIKAINNKMANKELAQGRLHQVMRKLISDDFYEND